MSEYNDKRQNTNEYDYGYSHQKDRDPYGTNLARFDSAKHDICNYIHKLQSFFSTATVHYDDQEKCQILFERIGEKDKEKTTYGFEQSDFFDWSGVTAKIVRRYPPTNPMRYEEDLKRNTQEVMNLPVSDYFGAFKNMYSRKQLFEQANSTPLAQTGIDERNFVRDFVKNCRQHENLFLLRKINERAIYDISSLYRVIQENEGEFLTYQQVAQRESQPKEKTFFNMISNRKAPKKPTETKNIKEKLSELEKKAEKTETNVSDMAQTLQNFSTESKKATETLSNHFLNFTEEVKEWKRDSESHRNDSNSNGYDQRGFRGRQRYEQSPHRSPQRGGYEFRRERSFDRSPHRGRDRESSDIEDPM
jgi:hypothetical protein